MKKMKEQPKTEIVKQKISERVEETRKIQREMTEKILTLVTAGFGLVAALAWNDAIQTFFKEIIDPYLKISSGLAGRFIYAILVTAIVVFFTYQLSKFLRKTGTEQ